MPLSTEVFVMMIFISGLPFFYVILRDSGLPGKSYFLLAYVFLVMCNCFTVVEEFWLNSFFNFCEHLFISLASVVTLLAVLKMTSDIRRNAHRSRGD